MSCNCGRKRRTAATSKPKPKPAEQDQQQQKQQGGTQSFALITSGGRTVFGSQLEADAANARLGGIGTVRRI